jgi:hypothetical protein
VGKKNELPKPTLPDSKDAIVFGGAILLLLLLIPYAIYCLASSTSARLDQNQVPVYFKRIEVARPLPQTLDPAQFQIANFREAYSVAKEIPFSRSSLATATASEWAIAACSIVSETCMRRTATYASTKRA